MPLSFRRPAKNGIQRARNLVWHNAKSSTACETTDRPRACRSYSCCCILLSWARTHLLLLAAASAADVFFAVIVVAAGVVAASCSPSCKFLDWSLVAFVRSLRTRCDFHSASPQRVVLISSRRRSRAVIAGDVCTRLARGHCHLLRVPVRA